MRIKQRSYISPLMQRLLRIYPRTMRYRISTGKINFEYKIKKLVGGKWV